MKRLVICAAAAFVFGSAGSAQLQQNVAKGFSVDKSYHIDDFDSINTFNGNLGVTIPIGQRWVVSSALSYQLALTYAGNVWQFQTEEDEYWNDAGNPPGLEQIWVEHAHPGWYDTNGVVRNVNAGLGWNLTLGYLETGGEGGMPYVSPDGARHVFYDKLNDSDDAVAGITYTRDGSYLRRRIVDGLEQIEFPDGTRHHFNMITGRIAAMYDRFGNSVTIEYRAGSNCATDPSDCADDWYITDGIRNHVVDLKRLKPSGDNTGATSYSFDVVKSVTFARGTAAQSVYTFSYGDGDPLIGISRAIAKKQDCRVPPVVLAAILESVTLPDSTKYELTTDRGDAARQQSGGWSGRFSSTDGSGGGLSFQQCTPAQTVQVNPEPSVSGHLLKIRRPTGAVTEWTYQTYGFPPLVPPNGTCRRPHIGSCDFVTSARSAIGVKERIDWNRDGDVVLSKRTYAQQGASELTSRSTTVTTYATVDEELQPASSQVHYYSTHFSQFDVLTRDYGLPFTEATDALPPTEITNSVKQNPDTGGRFLSTQLFDDAHRLLRYSYVKYAADSAPYPGSDTSTVNRRVVSERTVHLDDAGNVSSEVITDHGEFDGLGHFRTSTTGTSSRSSAPAVNRTVTTLYNAPDEDVDSLAFSSGTHPSSFEQIPSGSPWVLKTYSSQTVTEGGKSSRTLFSFDPDTGFLERRRTLAEIGDSPDVPGTGESDVIAVFTQTGGNVTGEAWYGGDEQAVGTGALAALELPASPAFSIDHTWSSGVLATSKYTSGLFDSLSRVIDSATGLPSSSTDPSGLVTSYEYDSLGRLAWSIAPDGLHTEYAWSTPSNANATVTIRQRNGSKVASSLATASVEYDELGRVTIERRQMPDSSYSLRQTLYDTLGRVESVSEWCDAGLPEASRPKTTFTYDALGRVLSATGPDGAETTTVYTGVRKAERTIGISTAAGPETSATTAEVTDDLGRLVQVTEPEGTVTTYGYDVGGRLSTVAMNDGSTVQSRTFNYDGRGFLTSETHPESGTTSFQYDARGHVTTRSAGGTSVDFLYDAAERLLTVSQGALLLKEFTFDRSNSGTETETDRSMGKLAAAIRHNHDTPEGDLTVTETYVYKDPAGRMSAKETTLATGEQFSESYTYNRLGAPLTVAYPACISNCSSIAAPSRTVTNNWSRGLLTGVGGYGSIGYAKNGMITTVTHLNAGSSTSPVDHYEVDSTTGMTRPLSIRFAGFCNDLRVDALTPKSVISGQPANLTATAPGEPTYLWFEVAPDGTSTALPAQTGSTLTVPVSTARQFFVRVGNGTCTIDSNTVTVSVAACATTVALSMSNSSPIEQGASRTIRVTLTGATPWTLSWSPNVPSCTTANASFNCTVSPLVTTTYTVTATDSNGCSASSAPLTVTVVPPAPQNLVATAISATQVALTWTFGGSAVDSFEIQRRRAGTGWEPDGTVVTSSATRPALANSAYLYRVRAVKSNTPSGWSAVDLATTITFADDPVVGGATIVSAQHLMQLRTGANAVRALWNSGLAAATFTDPTPALSRVKALHLQEVRTVLDEARAGLGLAALQYTGELAAAKPIRAIHVNELRGGVR